MADQGAILFDGKPVKVNGLIKLRYAYENGSLYGFTLAITGVKYIHLVEKDAKKNSKEFQQIIPKGYYSENAFFEYQFDESKLKNLLDTKYDDNFKYVEIDDTINVTKIRLFSPFVEPNFVFGDYETYTLTYSGQVLVDNQGNIVPPPIPFVPVVTSMNLGPIAKLFYKNNINKISLVNPADEKYKIALTIANIAISIDNIRSFIYPLFYNTIPEFADLKTSQDDFWKTNIFTNATYGDIKKYENAMYNFYRYGYINKLKIEQAKGYEKLYWLTLGMSVNSLTVLTPLNKISLLSWMQLNVRLGQRWLFLNDNEGLIVKIIESVTQSQSDLFLNALFSYSETYYNNLFALLFDQKDFEILGHLLKRKFGALNKVKFIDKGFLIMSAEEGITIETILGEKFIENFKNSFNSSDINFKKSEVKFAFVRKAGNYDTEPFTTFKYNN